MTSSKPTVELRKRPITAFSSSGYAINRKWRTKAFTTGFANSGPSRSATAGIPLDSKALTIFMMFAFE